jgi:hypothetical protein
VALVTLIAIAALAHAASTLLGSNSAAKLEANGRASGVGVALPGPTAADPAPPRGQGTRTVRFFSSPHDRAGTHSEADLEPAPALAGDSDVAF